MSDNPRCEETRWVAAELALGVAVGNERARAVEHLERCAVCRRDVASLTEVVDELLLLAPEREPPLGFEARVAESIGGRRRRRRRWPRILGTAATIVVVAGAAVLGMSLATSSDRRLGELYRATLERADGKYFGVEPLQSPGAGRAGHLFVYAGEPSWVFAVVPDAPSGESYRVEARTRSGERHVIGTLLVRDGRGAGGFPLPVDLADVGEVRIIPVDGGPSLEAHIPEGS